MTLEASIAENTIKRAVKRYKEQTLFISENLLGILKEIDASNDIGTKEGYIKWAQFEHGEELDTLYNMHKKRELNDYVTCLRQDKLHGSGDEFFVVLSKHEGYKKVLMLDGVKDFFKQVGFREEDIERAIKPFKNKHNSEVYEVGVMVDRLTNLPWIFIRPSKGSGTSIKSETKTVAPKSTTIEEGLAIVKNTYALYDPSLLFFDTKMLTKDDLGDDEEKD